MSRTRAAMARPGGLDLFGTEPRLRSEPQNPSGRQVHQQSVAAGASRVLAGIARQLAADSGLWRPLLQVDTEERWYTRLTTGPDWEAWLLTWCPGQGTDLHDHGGSAGAFTVLAGQLEELTPACTESTPDRLASRVLSAGQIRPFGRQHIHQVIGIGDQPAASLHVYGPALTVMNRYHLDPERGPVLTVTERVGTDW